MVSLSYGAVLGEHPDTILHTKVVVNPATNRTFKPNPLCKHKTSPLSGSDNEGYVIPKDSGPAVWLDYIPDAHVGGGPGSNGLCPGTSTDEGADLPDTLHHTSGHGWDAHTKHGDHEYCG